MDTKWLWGLGIIFVVGTIISNILEYINPYEGVTTIWTAYSSWQAFFDSATWSNAVTGIGDTLVAIWNMFIWNYSFFEGTWELVRWIICLPLSVALFVPLLISVAQTLAQWVSAILPW